MRPPSKHGLERKYKSWRKGKSEKKVGDDKRPTNTSLRNRLRGQKRLLAKLEKSNEDGKNETKDKEGDETKDKEALKAGVRTSIIQLEKDIATYEVKEREKKNAAKYHQVKFIERQKLTRLEKAIRSQLHKLQNTSSPNINMKVELHENKNKHKSVEQLEQELQSIAMDQLYIAFHPMDMKYMALFQQGNVRVVDDERGLLRRRGVWDKIREELNKNKNGDGTGTGDNNGNTKEWFNFDAAKEALLSMPEDTYPNASYSVGSATSSSGKDTLKSKTATKKASESNEKSSEKTKATSSDGRFAMSKELDGKFNESTTGADYQKESMKREESDSSDVDSSSSEDDNDDADPLKGFDGEKKKKEVLPASTSASNAKKQEDGSSSSSAPSSSSSSSSSSSDDSSSDSDSDSSVDMKPPTPIKPNREPGHYHLEKEDKDEEDDFFTTDNKISTEDVFTQVQNDKKKYKKNYEDMPYNNKDGKGDKSKGFRTQNQSKKEYRDYQHREKRQKFG